MAEHLYVLAGCPLVVFFAWRGPVENMTKQVQTNLQKRTTVQVYSSRLDRGSSFPQEKTKTFSFDENIFAQSIV